MVDVSALKGYERTILGSSQLQLLGMLTSEVTSHIESDHIKASELKQVFDFNPTYRTYSDMFKSLTLSLGSSKVLPKLFKLKKIIYKHIAIEHNFSIIVLLVPRNFEFSLHNHPQMLVVTRLLSGSITMESMDKGALIEPTISAKQHLLVDNNLRKTSTCSSSTEKQSQTTHDSTPTQEKLQPTPTSPQTPQIVFTQKTYQVENWKRRVLRPGQTNTVFPNTGNIHRIIAQQDSLIVDILMPDYADQSLVQFYEYCSAQQGIPTRIRTIPSPKQQNDLQSLDQLISNYH